MPVMARSRLSPQPTLPRAKKVELLALFLLLLVPLLYPLWLPWIGMFLVVADPLQKADALVILAGDENERIAAGARLFQAGYSGWFILTDMRLQVPDSEGVYSATVKRKAVEQGVPAERVLLVPGPVATTYEEAASLKEFAVSQGFSSLIVVTSPFHTRRARLLLREAFRGAGVTLIVRPALEDGYRAEAWWQNSMDRRLTGLEYVKILAHLLGCREYGDCAWLPRAWIDSWQLSGPGE